MFYVTMTDTFFTRAWADILEGRKNKLVFPCETWEEAETVRQNAENRSDQKSVNICTRKPYYSPRAYYTEFKTREEYPCWFIPGYFSAN